MPPDVVNLTVLVLFQGLIFTGIGAVFGGYDLLVILQKVYSLIIHASFIILF